MPRQKRKAPKNRSQRLVPIDGERVRAAVEVVMDGSIREAARRLGWTSSTLASIINKGLDRCREWRRDAIADLVGPPVTSAWLGGETDDLILPVHRHVVKPVVKRVNSVPCVLLEGSTVGYVPADNRYHLVTDRNGKTIEIRFELDEQENTVVETYFRFIGRSATPHEDLRLALLSNRFIESWQANENRGVAPALRTVIPTDLAPEPPTVRAQKVLERLSTPEAWIDRLYPGGGVELTHEQHRQFVTATTKAFSLLLEPWTTGSAVPDYGVLASILRWAELDMPIESLKLRKREKRAASKKCR